jgi:RecA/RadA recombinase
MAIISIIQDELFHQLLDQVDNEYASVAEDGIIAGDITGYVDTGSYAMNALVSGSIYKGIPNNKRIGFAGEPSVGKTYYALNVVKQFLIDNPKGFCFYFETESAISKQMLVDRGIDVRRVGMIPVGTIQEFRTQAIKILDKYMLEDEKTRPPMMMCLDSLGNLSTTKEVEDIAEGKDTRDMTRAALIKGGFRVLTLKLGKAKVPLVLTNHVYDVIGSYIPMKKASGGSGFEYAADIILFLTKKTDKQLEDDSGRTGTVITATVKKSRITVPDRKVDTWLNYTEGLDRYYGLLDLAERFGLVKKISTKYEFPDGTKAFEKSIKKEPEKYFTKELLDSIDELCQYEFLYGAAEKENGQEVETGQV